MKEMDTKRCSTSLTIRCLLQQRRRIAADTRLMPDRHEVIPDNVECAPGIAIVVAAGAVVLAALRESEVPDEMCIEGVEIVLSRDQWISEKIAEMLAVRSDADVPGIHQMIRYGGPTIEMVDSSLAVLDRITANRDYERRNQPPRHPGKRKRR
jgi:hypothetical protein